VPAGDPFTVAEQVSNIAAFGMSQFSVSDTGVLVYNSSGTLGRSQLTWFDRTGKPVGTVGEQSVQLHPSLSPDGKQVLTGRHDAQSSIPNLWTIDLASGISTRLTFDPKVASSTVWSPDSAKIIFWSNRNGTPDLYQMNVRGRGKEELLLKSPNAKFATDWSLDGRFVLFNEEDPKTQSDVWVLPLSGDAKPIPFVRTEFDERAATMSPDGKWIAYQSDASGKPEIYVQPFPANGNKWQVSSVGGTFPKWRRDGRELYYFGADRKMMAVEVKAGAAFEAGAPTPLFDTGIGIPLDSYAVTSDGKRFLMRVAEGSGSSPATVVLNWTAGIKR